MITPEPLDVMLVKLVDHIPLPRGTASVGADGHANYTNRLFPKALIIMSVQHLHKVHELLAVLDCATAEMQMLRSLLWQRA